MPAIKLRSPLREEALESWDHFCSNEVVYLGDPMGTLGNSREIAAELYRNLSGWIDIQFVLHGQRDAYYVAIIRRDALYQSRGKVVEAEAGEKEINGVSIDGNTSMLVEVAYFVQPPQRMRFIGCSSVVWLKKFELADGFVGNSVGGSITEAISNLERIDFVNRALCVFGRNASETNERPNQLVERSSHVVESVPSNQGHRIGQFREPSAKDVPLMFKIVLADNAASIRGGAKLLDFPIQTLQMFVRPTQLQLSVRYSWHENASYNLERTA